MFKWAIIGNLPKFNEIVDSLDATNKLSINMDIEQFSSELQSVSKLFFAKSYQISNHCKSLQVNQSKWFDKDCYVANCGCKK